MRTWLAVAILRPVVDSSHRIAGYTGAYAPVACVDDDLANAVKRIQDEFLENDLDLIGFEWLFDIDIMERDLTEYELQLTEKLSMYPVQFEHIHFHKADS